MKVYSFDFLLFNSVKSVRVQTLTDWKFCEGSVYRQNSHIRADKLDTEESLPGDEHHPRASGLALQAVNCHDQHQSAYGNFVFVRCTKYNSQQCHLCLSFSLLLPLSSFYFNLSPLCFDASFKSVVYKSSLENWRNKKIDLQGFALQHFYYFDANWVVLIKSISKMFEIVLSNTIFAQSCKVL